MKCEYCQQDLAGSFGSGRFCNKQCASGFSTKNKRTKINSVVSSKLKNKPPNHPYGFKKGHDPRRRKFGPSDWAKAVASNQLRLQKLYEVLTWEELPIAEKRRRISQEQGEKCCKCKNSDWLGQPIFLELHHVDGNRENEKRDNLELICVNCHSQTPNYRNRKRS